MAGKRKAEHNGADNLQAATEVGADQSESALVVLPADCRMAAQAALKDELLGALKAGAIVLDGAQVERTDTAALQMLVVFRRELDKQGGTLSWRGTSDALNEAAGLLGLTQILELPAAELA
jgi:phospholipid transport system transporter-binding protein